MQMMPSSWPKKRATAPDSSKAVADRIASKLGVVSYPSCTLSDEYIPNDYAPPEK